MGGPPEVEGLCAFAHILHIPKAATVHGTHKLCQNICLLSVY